MHVSSAAEFPVYVFSGNDENGTLLLRVKSACENAGDDVIYFPKTNLSKIELFLQNPIVIPKNCNGTVTLKGSDQVDTLIDGSDLWEENSYNLAPDEACLLYIYSDSNVIENLSFGNFFKSAICVFGRNNAIQMNRIGVDKTVERIPNDYGIVVSNIFAGEDPTMDGSGTILQNNFVKDNIRDGIVVFADDVQILNNQIFSQGGSGVALMGKDAVVQGNHILGNGGCVSEDDVFASQTVDCWGGWGKYGIYIGDGAEDSLIGGPVFAEHHNVIQYNRGAGITIVGQNTHTVSHNIISHNYTDRLGIDLNGDGVTPNDWHDADQGPNALLNSVLHFQTFPLVPALDGTNRYWSWGWVPHGNVVEIYGVDKEDWMAGSYHGGGFTYYQDAPIKEGMIHLLPADHDFKPDQKITTLVQDFLGNTSEFSINTPWGPDEDLDGIPDTNEKKSSTPYNLVSSYDHVDSDSDGLPDATEDVNRNGMWNKDQGETAAFIKDSDADGIFDWDELHGDNQRNPKIDTDPLAEDTDKDGLPDGMEDKNKNGIWEVYLGESNPLQADSDADGKTDLKE